MDKNLEHEAFLRREIASLEWQSACLIMMIFRGDKFMLDQTRTLIDLFQDVVWGEK